MAADFPGYKRLKPGPALPPADVADSQIARIQKAVIEIVAEGGYGTLKVRDVVRLANVSSRSFYQHFDSKDDCFVQTYGAIANGVRIGLIQAQVTGQDWRERAQQMFAAFAEAAMDDPAATHFALVDAYEAGPMALDRAHKVESNLVSMVAKSLGRAPGGFPVSRLLTEGVMAGIASVARERLRAGTEAELSGSESAILEWAYCFPVEAAGDLDELDIGLVQGNAALLEGRARKNVSQALGDNREIILAAISKLTTESDYAYADLTIPRIRAAAGISRRRFDNEFDSVEECFLAALERRAASAIADAATEQMAGSSWEGGVYRAISSLCAEIAGDSLLSSVCFKNDFLPNTKGSNLRMRLVVGVADQIHASLAPRAHGTELSAEASMGAVWALFHNNVLRDQILHRPEIAATLVYMALAPLVGGANVVSAIRDEQVA